MANKRLVSSEILNVELINKFLLKKATLSLNNSLKTEVKLNFEVCCKSKLIYRMRQACSVEGNLYLCEVFKRINLTKDTKEVLNYF